MTPARRERAETLRVVGLLLLALAVRLLPWRAVFRAGRVCYVDTDDYYHLRRILEAAASFPRLRGLDPYLGFPSGFRVNWPPLYDWCAGALLRLLALGTPSLRFAQVYAAFLPVAAALATLLFFHRAARRLLGPEAALWSLGFAAVLPFLVFYAMLGRPDHHCFENLWFVVSALAFLNLLDDPEKPHGATAALAAAGAAGVLFWIGSLVFSGILFLLAVSELLLPSRNAEHARPWLRLGAAFLLEAVLLLPVCGLSPWAQSGAVLFDAPSFFQPLLLASFGFATLALALRKSEGWTPRALASAAGAALAALVLAERGVASLALFAGAPLPIFALASEMQPLLKPFGTWSASVVTMHFGWSFWAVPVAALFLAREARRDPKKRLVLLWAAVTGALALIQTRYAYHYSLPAALLLGWGAEAAAQAAARRKAPLLAARVAAFVVVLILVAPALTSDLALAFAPAEQITGSTELLEACDWLREHAPPTRSLWRDEGAPEYGVYALHDDGDAIATLAQRPAAAGNMHFLGPQILDSIRFFFMTDPAEAYEFLRARRFRYVVLGDLFQTGTFQLYARLFRIPEPPREGFVYTRLYFGDGYMVRTHEYGEISGFVEPVEHFRLVAESTGFGVPPVKIFEVVPGAVVIGTCRARSVRAAISVVTNQRREFGWEGAAFCSRDGRYALNLPYAGDYRIGSTGPVRLLSVTEAQVQSGAKIPVDWR